MLGSFLRSQETSIRGTCLDVRLPLVLFCLHSHGVEESRFAQPAKVTKAN